MADLILMFFIIFLISLNVIFFTWSNKEELNLMVSGLILMALAPFVNFAVRTALLHFVDWSPEDTREGAGYSAAILALLTFINGVLLLMIGLHRWLSAFSKKKLNV
ncbi:inner-membrane translocator [Planococcus shixiaomingii]|uniref:inner-membrane translocator n=1 Tax=Planococcus shixiaomingii TaxID=3058393 RepID=UPI00260F16F5|nr:inner-membrane translocator [Planococcus sp. N022]WKA54490.1 inner-membrane translocator [Planococcus sp. N022]